MKLPSILGNRGARDKPKDSYVGSAYSFFFGRSTSGKNVNERTAMQTTAVYSCVRILAEAVASLPIHVYRYTETGKDTEFRYGTITGKYVIYCIYRPDRAHCTAF